MTEQFLVQASWATARGNMGGTTFTIRAENMDAARQIAKPRIYRDGRRAIDVRITHRPEANQWP